jgi:hypothetical protein
MRGGTEASRRRAWPIGCTSASAVADNYLGSILHSRAPAAPVSCWGVFVCTLNAGSLLQASSFVEQGTRDGEAGGVSRTKIARVCIHPAVPCWKHPCCRRARFDKISGRARYVVGRPHALPLAPNTSCSRRRSSPSSISPACRCLIAVAISRRSHGSSRNQWVWQANMASRTGLLQPLNGQGRWCSIACLAPLWCAGPHSWRRRAKSLTG